MTSQQNVAFTDQNPSYTYQVVSQPDATYSIADMDDADLGDFLSRPIKIAEYQWSTSLNFYEFFDPWTLFYTNPRVSNRIANFRLLRSKLHVKILVNGNGFYYGRLLANYIPMYTYDQFLLDRALIPQDNIAASQRPHIYLDPTTNQGGQLDLPFFNYNNAIDIVQGTWDQMGSMSIRTLTQLKHANGATDPITISVFAWASEVELSVPTSSNPAGLTPQMGYEQRSSTSGSKKKKNKPRVTVTKNTRDEYGSGLVSKPAATVARIAGMLKNAPVIGPYARATEIAASGVSNIAKLFGYSRPTSVDPITQLTPRYVGDIATTNIGDSIQKLTLDGKQELTVDGSTVGLSNVDEMTICSIVTRESYYTQFPWAMNTAPETTLFTTVVSPILWDEVAGSPGTEIHMPACCFGSLPFQNWRGSMKFRFQVVASNYHKGRLKVVYEPAIFGSDEYNTNYTHIIDISEDKDFTVSVGWGSYIGYLGHGRPGVNTLPFRTGSFTGVAPQLGNGLLKVAVVNDLTSPNSTVNNDITINVFVSAGDDFEVQNPDPQYIDPMTYYIPQGGYEPQSGIEVQADTENTSEPSKPMQTGQVDQMASSLDVADPASSVFFGEDVTSYRQCLRRYNYFDYFPCEIDGASGSNYNSFYLNYFPYYRGESGVNSAFGMDNNYCKMTLLNYLTPAYVGRRGGIRWKAVVLGCVDNNDFSLLQISREPAYTGSAATTTASTLAQLGATTSDVVKGINPLLQHTWKGSMITPAKQQPVVEAEIPYQRIYRFDMARNKKFSYNVGTENYMRIDAALFSQASKGNGLLTYCATGEDFSLFFFIGAPVMWYEPTIP